MRIPWEHIDDVAALVIIIGCFIAVFALREPQAWALLGAAAAWCFRSGVEQRAKNSVNHSASADKK